MKLLHCADVHLDSPLRGLARYDGAPVADLRGATRRAFENAIDLAIEEPVACVVIAGDLYDGDRDDYNTAIFLQRQLHRLADSGIPVVMVYGNHDAANAITKRLELPDNTHCFSPTEAETFVFEDLGLALHGRSYATRAETNDIAATYPPPVPGLFNVGVLHTAIDGKRGHDPYAPCSIDALARHGYGYWALGHVHQREVIDHGGVPIVFPGNLQGRHARELGPKGASVVEYDGDRVGRIHEHVLDVVRWLRVEIDASRVATLGALVDQARERIGKETADLGDRLCAVRVVVSGSSPLHAELMSRGESWQAQLRADVATISEEVWIEKIETTTSPLGSAPDEAVDELRDAVHGVVTLMSTDAEALAALVEEIRPLRTKLGSDFPDFSDLTGVDISPEGVQALLPQIEAMLLGELERGGE